MKPRTALVGLGLVSFLYAVNPGHEGDQLPSPVISRHIQECSESSTVDSLESQLTRALQGSEPEKKEHSEVLSLYPIVVAPAFYTFVKDATFQVHYAMQNDGPLR